MNDNRYNCNNPYTAWGPMAPFIAPWMQAMQAWACAISAFAPGPTTTQPWNCYSTRERVGRDEPAAPVPKVSVSVKSQYPTEVHASIDSGADAMPLTADPLNTAEEKHAPPLRSVTIKSECGHVQVQITVPTDQPDGRYSGAIRDMAGCKRGELTLEISKRPAPAVTPKTVRRRKTP